MNKIVAATLSIFLFGCIAPEHQSFQENLKPGVTLSESERIKISCEQKAIRDVPAAYITTQTRSSQAPVSTTCGYDYIGRVVCTDSGSVASSQTSVSDANQGLRNRVYFQCLNDKGFLLYTAPGCSAEQLVRFNSIHSDLRNYRTPKPDPQMCFLTSTFHGGKLAVAIP